MSFESKARALLAERGSGPVFVHSDVFRAARLVKPERDRRELLNAHVDVLRALSDDRGLWLPAFNYDFPRSGIFDVMADESQIGPIPEHFRMHFAAWRTPIPMFSVSGIGAMPEVSWHDETDPFGSESIFARLVERDGVILYYGETFAFNTLVHHAERRAEGPVYRYDKRFPGVVIMPDGEEVRGSLRSHVRPLGGDLEYDWPRLFRQALDADVCKRVDGNPEVAVASARSLCEFWIAEMKEDPLVLLDQKTRVWVEPALEELGRRFMIGDFEAPEMAETFARAEDE